MKVHVGYQYPHENGTSFTFKKESVDTFDKLKRKVEESFGVPVHLQYFVLFNYKVIPDEDRYLRSLKSPSDYYLAGHEPGDLYFVLYIRGTSETKLANHFPDTYSRLKYKNKIFEDFRFDYSTTVRQFKAFLLLRLETTQFKIVLNRKFVLHDDQYIVDLFFVDTDFCSFCNSSLHFTFIRQHFWTQDDYHLFDHNVKYSPFKLRIFGKNEEVPIIVFSPFEDDLLALPHLKQKIQEVLGVPTEYQVLHSDGKLQLDESGTTYLFDTPLDHIDFTMTIICRKQICNIYDIYNECNLLAPFNVILNQNHRLSYYFTEDATIQDLFWFIAEELKTAVSTLVLFIEGRLVDSSSREHLVSYYFCQEGTCAENVPSAHLILKPLEPNRSLSKECQQQNVSMLKLIRVKYQSKILANLSLTEVHSLNDVAECIETKYRIPLESQQIFLNGKLLSRSSFSILQYFYEKERGHVIDEITFQLSIRISLKLNNILEEVKTALDIEYLRYVDIQILSRQIRIDLTNEDIWSVLGVKYFIQKQQRISVRRQKLFHDKQELDNHEQLLKFYMDNGDETCNNILLSLILIQPETQSIKLPLYLDSNTHYEASMMILETETVTTLQERIANLCGIEPHLIKVRQLHGESWPLDKMIWEIRRLFKIDKLVQVVLGSNEGAKHLTYPIADLENERVIDMINSPTSWYEGSCQLVLDHRRTLVDITTTTFLRDVGNETIYIKLVKPKSCLLL